MHNMWRQHRDPRDNVGTMKVPVRPDRVHEGPREGPGIDQIVTS